MTDKNENLELAKKHNATVKRDTTGELVISSWYEADFEEMLEALEEKHQARIAELIGRMNSVRALCEAHGWHTCSPDTPELQTWSAGAQPEGEGPK